MNEDCGIWQGGSNNININAGTIQVGAAGHIAPPADRGQACPACGSLNWAHAQACTGCGLELHPTRRLAWRAAIVLLLAANVAASTRFLL